MDELIFSEAEYLDRQKKLEARLETDFAIIFNRPELFYYSNTGLDGVLTIDNDWTRYVRRNPSLAQTESVVSTRLMTSFRLFKDLGKKLDISTLGLELDLVPHKTVEYIKKAFGHPDLIDISPILRYIRSIKSSEELELMRKAIKQTDESFAFIEDKIKPGKTELEISAEIEHFLRREGHPGWVNVRMFHHNLTSSAYVMAGESTATLNSSFGPVSGQGLCKIHKNGPSKRKIKNNEAVLIDTTGVIEGYTGDETRTFFLGSPDPKLRKAYEAAKTIQKRTSKILKAGSLPSDIFEELHDLAAELGLEPHFMGIGDDKVPFVGHGIGLELDDLPIITDKYETPLEMGNIVAMEPKFIFDKPKTGVGIEDDWLVGEHGAERLTQFPW